MDRMREAVFSSLGPYVEGARVLDLFAGVGSYGLEALSRGASGATFVEQNRGAIQSLKVNLQKVEMSLSSAHLAKVISQPVERFIKAAPGEAYDLIFVDPPYAQVKGIFESLLGQLSGGFVTPGKSILAFEMPYEPESIPKGWELINSLGKGREDARVLILKPIRA